MSKRILRKLSHDGAKIIPPDEIKLLQDYHWPGNVRELRNVIERSLILSQGHLIRPSLVINLNTTGQKTEENKTSESPWVGYPAEMCLSDVERAHIERVLEKFGGNQSQAARSLKIGRSTLIRKLDEYSRS